MKFDKAFYTRHELLEMGYSNYRIGQLVENKSLKKINVSYYQNVNYKGKIHNYNYIPLFIHEGTICLLSAASYYGYIKKPKEIDIAVPQGSNFRSRYKHPPFKFHYQTKEKYKIGTIEIKDDVNSFKIYNKERTICDIIHDRKNIDKKYIKTILKAYLKDPEHDLERLNEMAEVIHCKETLEIYLDMLI